MNKTLGAEISPIRILLNSTNGHILCGKCNGDTGYGSIKGVENMHMDEVYHYVCDPCADLIEGMDTYDPDE